MLGLNIGNAGIGKSDPYGDAGQLSFASHHGTRQYKTTQDIAGPYRKQSAAQRTERQFCLLCCIQIHGGIAKEFPCCFEGSRRREV